MKLHPEVLGSAQRRVLARIGPQVTKRGFYLAGGTAVALRLGHRHSLDLDWFTSDRIPAPLRLAQHLRDEGVPFRTEQVARGTLIGSVSRVRMSFFEYRYPLLERLQACRLLGCSIARRSDLASMKLAAVAQRGAKKDFIDIYALSRFVSLRRMLGWYQQKYSISDILHVCYSLAYFDEADRERMPSMVWSEDWRAIKKALQSCLTEMTS